MYSGLSLLIYCTYSFHVTVILWNQLEHNVIVLNVEIKTRP